MRYLLLLLLLIPSLASAGSVKTTWNQVVFQEQSQVIQLTKNWAGQYEWIDSCSTDTWVFHYSLIKNFWDFSLVKNMITCVDQKYVKYFSEYTTWPYIGIFLDDDGGKKYNYMPIVIPHGSNAFNKYYIVSHPKGKIQEWNHGYMIDVTAQIFDASWIWKNLLMADNEWWLDIKNILNRINTSNINIDIFGKKYVRFRWNIAYLDTDISKNDFLITKKKDVLWAGYIIEKFGNFWRWYRTSNLSWDWLYNQSLLIYSPKENEPKESCPVEDYKNQQIHIDGSSTEYQNFSTEGVRYSALPTYNGIVQKMKPSDFLSHQDASYIVLYDIAPIWKNPKKIIQKLVDAQNKIVPYPVTSDTRNQNHYNKSQIQCKVEKYDTSSNACTSSLTKKDWYQFFHIARDPYQVKLQEEKGVTVSCGHILLGPSEPNQYFIYSEKSGKILYVNTTQNPYPFDPTSIEF